MLALRFDNWKIVFMEQRVRGTLEIWAEPFVALRVPKLFNLRTDPFERADVTSNTYYDWMLDNVYIVLAATAVVTQFLQTFEEFPPRQRAASFTIDQAVAKLQDRPDHRPVGGAMVAAQPASRTAGRGRTWSGSPGHVPDGLGSSPPRGSPRLTRSLWTASGSTGTVTNADFARFVRKTGHLTVAERPADPADYPGARPELLVPASTVFQSPGHRVDLSNHYNWVDVCVGGRLAPPPGTGQLDQEEARPPGGPRRLGRRPGLCPLGREGAAHRGRVGAAAAAWTAPPTPGATT